MLIHLLFFFFFFFNNPATTEIYTLSLHDALPIYFMSVMRIGMSVFYGMFAALGAFWLYFFNTRSARSEEHTSELQSHSDLVCRLLLEKKKKKKKIHIEYNINIRKK